MIIKATYSHIQDMEKVGKSSWCILIIPLKKVSICLNINNVNTVTIIFIQFLYYVALY